MDDDARNLLRASAESIVKAATFSYHAKREPGGAFAGQLATTEGDVTIARIDGDDALGARLRATGVNHVPHNDQPLEFTNAYDGKTIQSLRGWEKTLIEGEPAQGAGMLLSDGGTGLLLEPFFTTDSYGDELRGKSRLAGESTISEIACVIVEVTMPPGTSYQRIRWHISKDDHLPRRSEMLYTIDGAEGSQITSISALRSGSSVKVDDDQFRIALPDGFERKSFEQASTLLPVGAEAPDWTLTDAQGQQHTLSKMRGKIAVLDFWATWCGPCKAAMPAVQSLHEKFRHNDVLVLGISCKDRGKPAEYFQQKGYTYGCLLDGDAVATQYGVNAIPVFYIIGRDGKILFRQEGYNEAMEQRVAKLIEEHLQAPHQ